MVRMMKGIHTFKKDCDNQTSLCSQWGSLVYPFPSVVKKMEVYLEERRNIADPFHPTHTYTNRPTISPFVKPQTSKKKKTRDSTKRRKKVNHQVNKKQYKVRKLKVPFSLSKTAMPTFTLASVPTTNTATTAMTTLLVPSKPPSTLSTPTLPKTQASSQTSKTWARPYIPIPFSALVHSDWSLEEDWD